MGPSGYSEADIKYLKLLSAHFPNRRAANRERFLIQSELDCSKRAEIFLSDLHGEYEAFQHILKNGSGVVKQRIELLFPHLSKEEINRLSTIIYYPEEKIELLRKQGSYPHEFILDTAEYLLLIIKDLSTRFSGREFVKLIDPEYRDILFELMNYPEKERTRMALRTIIREEWVDELMKFLADLIRKLSIDRIHIIGDIFDRGPLAEEIMDELMTHHAVDIQWGNHDVVWMGAASGSTACMANVLRLSLRYGNTNTLEKGYGIHLMPLASFALEHYQHDHSKVFETKESSVTPLNSSESTLNRLMHKAITIIQFKLEGQLILRRPEYHLNDRLHLDKINGDSIVVKGQKHRLKDTFLPTLDTQNPFELSQDEQELVDLLMSSFLNSERLQRHVDFLFEKGSMYHVSNDNLLYHGCIPLTEEGMLDTVDFGGGALKGKELMDFFDLSVRNCRNSVFNEADQNDSLDLIWYLWAGPYSPVFGKSKMATFERYFLDDRTLLREQMNPYYRFRDDQETCEMILAEFGLNNENAIILNGHVPVSVKKGENPIKGGGKLVVIDGGLAKAYQHHTGIAGYTLIHNSRGRRLIAQEPFESKQNAIEKEVDIAYSKELVNRTEKTTVKETSEGREKMTTLMDLSKLVQAFRQGLIEERE